MPPLIDADLTGRILGTFYDVYNHFGYGFSETVYARALELELTARGMHVIREAPLEVTYHGIVVGDFHADLIVESRVVLELKAGERFPSTAQSQLLNYLRAASLRVGLVLFFGPRPDFKRVVA